MGFFFTSLVSERSQDSTTKRRLAEVFNSSSSDNFSTLLKSPSWTYATSVAHVSNPSKIWVAYTIVAPRCNKSIHWIGEKKILLIWSFSMKKKDN